MKRIMFSTKYGLQQAVLSLMKDMTRRVAKLPLIPEIKDICEANIEIQKDGSRIAVFRGYEGCEPYTICKIEPQYQVGEVVAILQSYEEIANTFYGQDEVFRFGFIRQVEEAHELLKDDIKGWTNKMFVKAELMPHQICITNISIERLQDISDADCLREGIMEGEFMNTWDTFYFDEWGDVPNHITFRTPYKAFEALIKKLSGRKVWERNPWVFVYEFKYIK